LKVFEKLFEHCSSDRDMEYLMLDSTISARSCVCRWRTKKEGAQSLGRSRGGFSTKIHLATDALGNALRFILTGGERNNITRAEQLIENFTADYVIADKSYDAEAFVLKLKERNSAVVIPSRINHKEQREIDT